MSIIRAIRYIAVLTLAHVSVTLGIGVVLILAAVALQFLTEGIP